MVSHYPNDLQRDSIPLRTKSIQKVTSVLITHQEILYLPPYVPHVTLMQTMHFVLLITGFSHSYWCKQSTTETCTYYPNPLK